MSLRFFEYLDSLEAILGHSFRDRTLLIEAITHGSFRAEHQLDFDYERLEFLGDALLQAEVSEILFRNSRGLSQGEMTRLRTQMVSGDALRRITSRYGLGSFLLVGEGMKLGHLPKGPKADVVEALLAAVYLDGGGGALKKLVEEWFEPSLGDGGPDAKTALQEFCLRATKCLPVYDTILKQDSFHSQVTCSEGLSATGTGRSKKEAEQMAAKKALELFFQVFSGG